MQSKKPAGEVVQQEWLLLNNVDTSSYGLRTNPITEGSVSWLQKNEWKRSSQSIELVAGKCH